MDRKNGLKPHVAREVEAEAMKQQLGLSDSVFSWKRNVRSPLTHRIHVWYIYTCQFSIKIDQMWVNIPVPWIL